MSKNIDLEKPLSDEDREYLKLRSRHADIEENDRIFGNGKFAEDHEEEYRGTNTVAKPQVEPGSPADNPPSFVGVRPYNVDPAVWGGVTNLTEQEATAQESGDGDDLDGVDSDLGDDNSDDDDDSDVAIEDLTVDQLKEELKSRNLKVSGNHAELVERLSEALAEE